MHIREIWNIFVTKCIRYYEPLDYNVTIDDRCLILTLTFLDTIYFSRKYLSRKRDKYGIKIVTMNDSDTFYMINAQPYIVKVRTEPLEFCYVKKISNPIHNTYRNIT